MPDLGAPPRRATFRLMGAFRLVGANGDTVAVPSRRARGLLAYLALAPDHVATRERLCGLLWGDRGEAQARASLRQCLLELREVMSAAGVDILDRRRESVALKVDAFESDVAGLVQAIDGGDSAALSAFVELIGSARLLDDLDIGGLYRDWLEQSRAQLDRSLGLGVLHRLERLEAERDWRTARSLADAYLRRDALDEAVVAAAIRADIATGHTTTAHRRYQILQSAMAKEFGVPPGPATRDALGAAPGQRPTEPATVDSHAQGLPTTTSAAASPSIPLVIVSLFEAGESPDQPTNLAAILREEILSGLSRFNDLRVLTDPRPLDMVVGDPSPDRAEAYALGASLRASAAGQRLIVQLLTTGERRVIWSERFILPSLEIMERTDDIIARVVGAVLPTIDADRMRHYPVESSDDRSYMRYLLARGVDARARTFEEARAAADALETMLAADPDSGRALLPLAFMYNTDFFLTRAGSSGPKERARALELAKMALARDRANGHAYVVIGWCYLRRRQWAPAKAHFEQALALNPFHVRRMMEIGYGLLFLDELDTARALLDRCLLLNPSPQDGYFTDLGLLSLIRGDHDLAESYFELGADPEIWSSVFGAMNSQMAGRPFADKARVAVAKVRAIWPDTSPLTGESLVEWILSHHPFRSPEVEGRFVAAASATFGDL